MTEVEVFRSGSYESVDFKAFDIELGISTRKVAPTAAVRLSPRESISAGQAVRIQIDGSTKFEGTAESGGTKRESAPMKVPLRHDAAELFNATATFTLTSPTDEEVLNAALSNAGTQASFTLNYVGSATSLANDYEADNRRVVAIFRDMMDRAGRVWWVDPASNTITVDTEGGRGSWQALDAATDRVAVESFDTGSVETVVNDVTVYGTGGEQVTGSASDATSQSNYGVRSKTYNVSYPLTQSEADAIASALLQADPVAEGEVLAGRNVGAVEDPQVNKTIDLTDDSKDIDASGLTIEAQTIEQGRASLSVGGGVGASVAEHNRAAKSDRDVTEPGSVYDSDRLADTAVTEAKLADLAVTTQKLQNNAVINGKLDDLSVSETKIQDDSISTPKLKAGSVTANEIEADTITAAEIAAGTITALEILSDTITASEIAAGTITALEIESGTITANEIAAGTLTANEIDVLNLATGDISIGTNADNRIEYDVETISTTDYPTLQPSVDLGANLGLAGQRWRSLRVRDISGNSITLGNETTPFTAQPSGSSVSVEITENSGVPDIRPSVSSTGFVGSSASYWASMRSDAYFEESPVPSEDLAADVDLDELRKSDWYDLPEYVREGTARKQAETEGFDGEDADVSADGALPDPDGVELGTMTNYLLEVNRAQQEVIAGLESRLSDLAERVDSLES